MPLSKSRNGKYSRHVNFKFYNRKVPRREWCELMLRFGLLNFGRSMAIARNIIGILSSKQVSIFITSPVNRVSTRLFHQCFRCNNSLAVTVKLHNGWTVNSMY